MRKRDFLLKPFRKDRAPTPSPQTPDLPLVTANSSPTLSAPVVHRPIAVGGTGVNPALDLAIQKHFGDLPEADKDAFQKASEQISQDNLLSNVKAYDDIHGNGSSLRPRTKTISKFLSLLNRCMAGISTGIQANPNPSSIIVGAVQLAISLAIEFVNFFNRLTDMLNCFNDYLGPLAEYAKASDTTLMRQTLASVYGDLLEFSMAACRVFVDNRGVKREWVSMRTFLRVQWEPFEVVFGDIETKFKHHLNVLHHSAESSHLNTLLRLEKQQKCQLFCLTI
jgi:ankyrin repeat domain-containing protein 50